METVISCVFFLKAGKFKTSMARVPFSKLSTNLACSSSTGEYRPEDAFCTELAALGPTSVQYIHQHGACARLVRGYYFPFEG